MIFSFMPDWILFFIVFVVLCIIYFYLPEETRKLVNGFLASYGIYIFIFLGWLYFRKKWGFVYEKPDRFPADLYYATFMALFLLGLYHAGRWFVYEQRYFTNSFICNGVSGSCNRRQDIGDYAVLFIGTCGSSDEHLVIPFPLAEKIVVVPKTSLTFVGNHLVSTAQVFKCNNLIEVDESIAHFIETDTFAKICKNEVFYGEFDEKLRTDNPNVTIIESNLKKANTRIGELVKMLEGKLKATKGFISDTLAMVDKVKGRSPFGSQAPPPRRDDE